MIKSEEIVGAVQVLSRYRMEIVRQVVLLIILMIVIYFNSGYIINILSKPLNDLPLFFLTPIEGVMVKMEIAIVDGITLFVPLVTYRIIFLASSKISKSNRRMLYFLILPFAVIAFAGGVIFAYKFVIPPAIDFLLSSGNEFMSATISGGSYFSFITIFLVAIGAVFELPLVFVVLSKFGIVSYRLLSEKRKISILLIVIAAAVITPTPDIFSLIIVALPMVVLYEISIWWIFILEKSNKRKAYIVN
jgi:sec-independent protein translocase protein TatC